MTDPRPRGQDPVRTAWDAIAPAFDSATTPVTRPLAEEALRRVDVGPGVRLLDVATGSGALAIPAARAGARVVATDISPVMIERLQERAREAGLHDLEATVMDGTELAFDDGTFDVAASQNGVSLFPDVGRGLRELARVVRPGGRVMIIAFASFAQAEFLTVFLSALKDAVPGFTGPSTDPPPLPFQLADPESLRRRLQDAGLQRVHVDTIPWRMEIRSARHLWDVTTSSNPVAASWVAGIGEEQREAILDALTNSLRQRSNGRATSVLTTQVNVGVGAKPEA